MKLDRIEEAVGHYPERTFAFDEFGPGDPPDRRQLLGPGTDTLWGINHRSKGTGNTLTALKSILAACPDGEQVFVVLDNLSAHKAPRIRRWAATHAVELCNTATYASWANPRRILGCCAGSPSRTRTTVPDWERITMDCVVILDFSYLTPRSRSPSVIPVAAK